MSIEDAIKLRLTPIEGLTLHRALMQFAHELSNKEVDRITAIQMCDAYIEAMERMAKHDTQKHLQGLD